MIFSRITLKDDLEAKELFNAICRDEYKIHQHLWALFSISKDQERDFLYRKDETSKWPKFYAVAPREPKDESGLWNIESHSYNPKLKKGQRLSFSLLANPIVSKLSEKVRANSKKHWKKVIRCDVVMDAKKKMEKENKKYLNEKYWGDLLNDVGYEWLLSRKPVTKSVIGQKDEKAEDYGFAIKPKEVKVDSYRQMQFYKSGSDKPIKISTLQFSGILTVTDPKIFVENALFRGIGPAKAFGCGLMLVKPV
jgi:CRISPR system Cascade subunit CasE